ncbi:hypothetical protein CGGC5_v005887 [Colletotrichum fructicola Nara gc5]|uniref:Uncharacterized protein n=1 Tax=Colletotrichum fructicola (strain Nara gc5) TaxID=1213859 RepID=A0A7J6IEP6_COLFN|nr:hypothetical protein CGGC5_v016024 [Colletotrichum fructicola Nara gc5]KAF4487197.1 hypothetical protein CGGC5_v005887 [Colletotrichum fructicola Nara gc5]KAF4881147.1 hypothetical protein CGCFRS4_v015845 [Colletotrichum fructicola]
MCDYTQREFRCSHKRYIVSRWCKKYIRTQERCQLCVTHFEYRGDELCSECKPSAPIPWENMIRRNNTPIGL